VAIGLGAAIVVLVGVAFGARSRQLARRRKNGGGIDGGLFFSGPGDVAAATPGGAWGAVGDEDEEAGSTSERWSFGLQTARAWWDAPVVPPVEGRGFRGDFKADVGKFLENDPTEGLMGSDYTTSPLVGRGSDLSFGDNQQSGSFL